MADISLGLSFDDVLLVPALSEILPTESDISTNVTSGIRLNIPVVSAAMDTVSETELAVALAREGGMGVIHRACSIAEQASMVSRVKRSENAVIQKPLTVRKEQSIDEVRAIMAEHGFSGFPVVDADGRLEGMVTGRDLRYLDLQDARVQDVMTPREKLVTAPVNTELEDARRIL